MITFLTGTTKTKNYKLIKLEFLAELLYWIA